MADLKVSIITVCLNSEKTIERTVRSVLKQTYDNIEYLVIDGKSSDRTVEIVESYQEKFRERGFEFKLISEKDESMYEALNKGVRMASGELIGNINSDDWYEPCAVEEMVRFYEAQQYDLAWADLRILKSSGEMIKKAKIGRIWTTAGFCHPTMFSRKEILLKYPYACLQWDDDFDMVTRVHKDGKKICTLNKVLANYTFGGMSTKKSLANMCSRIKSRYQTYRRNGYSHIYWVYCFGVEAAKYILG